MKRNLSRALIALGMTGVMGLACGCQTVGEQTGFNPKNGVDPGPAGNVKVGLGTSTETQTVFCWDDNKQMHVGRPSLLVVREESPSQTFYNLSAGAGQGSLGAAALWGVGTDAFKSTQKQSQTQTLTGTPIRQPQ